MKKVKQNMEQFISLTPCSTGSHLSLTPCFSKVPVTEAGNSNRFNGFSKCHLHPFRSLAALIILALLFSLATHAQAACTYLLSTTNFAFTYAPNTGTVAVTTTAGCTWTVSTNNPWISISSATNNTNTGSAIFTAQANPFTVP